MLAASPDKSLVAQSLSRSPLVGVVRTAERATALAQARALLAAGVELVEITFTVPGASVIVRELLAERGASGPPWIGMGTVIGLERLDEALAAGAEFLVSPNASVELCARAASSGRFFIAGALTPTEIVAAFAAGADLVKVYPLPPVGGPEYLSVVRQPLGEIPMLAAGGFGVEEIPAYRRAGASAFGMGGPLFGESASETRRRVERALALARGQEEGP